MQCNIPDLVVDVGLAEVAPDGQIGEAQNDGVFCRDSMDHHVLVHVPSTVNLREGSTLDNPETKHTYHTKYPSVRVYLVAGETDPVLGLSATVLTRNKHIQT